jgi:hypothetical protein
MKTLTYKFYLGVSAISLCLAGAFFVLNKQSNSATSFPSTDENAMEANALASSGSAASIKEKAIPKSNDHSIAAKKFTKADENEFAKWMSERGHFTNKERGDYEHYDQKTLESLADAGDIKAIEALGSLHLKNVNFDAATHYYELGAIRGSTMSIATLGLIAAPIPGLDDENRRSAVIEGLAINKVLELRGDEESAKSQTDDLTKSYQRLFNEQLNISFEEQSKIDQRAEEIYSNWEAKRRELGLGEFDNSKSLGVKKFFDLAKSSHSKN